ncbi:DUF2806 domain-containing protein [Roseateles sp. DAIF2]|uniref:DUF2806 domain-containing protein n=1 Tax=Roseateles sp. DAIF2 TaxID=2714952 RepID=UPI0018A26C48|nr:DUF2806 domain-containing protein [Roseateles sp. DAIF2]QPF74467.1 DUF2806 domain-containing protein [Roseateles sp. DAIF2]
MEDLTGLGKPAEKLIDAVVRGVGTLYRPRAIRNEADAKAYEAKVLGVAAIEVEEAKARAQVASAIEAKIALADADEQLARRTRERLIQSELQRQQNIEAIAELAIENGPSTASDSPVADDWCRALFRFGADVSDAEMQLLFARVLAGEVEQPGSYSLRALSVMASLTKDDAHAFQTLCSICVDAKGHILQTPRRGFEAVDWLKPIGLPHSTLYALQEAGLLHDVDGAMPYAAMWNGKAEAEAMSMVLVFPGGRFRLTQRHKSNALEFFALRLTSVGAQLSRLVRPEFDRRVLDLIAKAYNADIEVTLDDPAPADK